MKYVILGQVLTALSRYHHNCVVREVVFHREAAEPISALLLALPQSAELITNVVQAGGVHRLIPGQVAPYGWTWLSLGKRTIGKGRRKFEAEFVVHIYSEANYEFISHRPVTTDGGESLRSRLKSDCE